MRRGNSPQEYRKIEDTRDSNFYKACVPEWWEKNLYPRPVFFNCGDRIAVINTYFALLEKHKQNPEISFLKPTNLFAIIDLDLQLSKIEDDNYPFRNTDDIFNDLYKDIRVNEENAMKHRIWITGLIHKEAYFLLPILQDIFDNYHTELTFNEKPLKLEDIYRKMADNIDNDEDLKENFARICERIKYCNLDFTDRNSLKNSWLKQFNNATDKQLLIYALLMIRKAKPYWKQISPSSDSDWTTNIDRFREQLFLRIGKSFYSQEDTDSKYHIPVFFKTLAKLIYS